MARSSVGERRLTIVLSEADSARVDEIVKARHENTGRYVSQGSVIREYFRLGLITKDKLDRIQNLSHELQSLVDCVPTMRGSSDTSGGTE